MKKYIFSFLIMVIINIPVVFSQSPETAVEWEKTTIDFEKIPYGKAVTVEFVFKNTGMIPLIISDVRPSCGCTVADYPKEPIPSGGKSGIKVTYDADTPGYFSKTITVLSNTSEAVTNLYIKGEVVK